MQDYGKFCYLDPQKTGSTFVTAFLRRHSALPEVAFRKHGRIGRKMAAAMSDRLFFISARDPAELYFSLYSYGVDRADSPFRTRLTRNGAPVEQFYDNTSEGFDLWLRFLLDPHNAETMGEGFTRRLSRRMGFQTYRFLALSFADPKTALRQVRGAADLRRAYEGSRLHRVVLRNWCLNADLAALIDAHLAPFLKDPDAALAELAAAEQRLNTSSRADREGGLVMPQDLLAKVRRKEWFLDELLARNASG